MTLADLLRTRRVDLDESLRSAASALGVPPTELAAYEHGRAVPVGLFAGFYEHFLRMEPGLIHVVAVAGGAR